MKRVWIWFITVLAVIGMGTAGVHAEEEGDYPSIPHMSLEEYPEVDGSLACIPLMEALVMEVTGCTEMEAEESLENFSNTNPSYERLMEGEAELILSYEGSAETKKSLSEAEDSGENELDLQPVGRDALVFIVNAGNPVEELTTQQIHDIYTGKITNWSDVGGEDTGIKAFQRRENSGSQTLMRLLLMGDEEIPEKQMISISEMEGLINTVMEYDNSANAIGYSVYYYASVMMGNDRLKFLAVDGVSPDNDTIRSGEYALSNPFYCGISEKSGGKAVLLRDWLLSEEGQQFVEDNGYVGAGPQEEQSRENGKEEQGGSRQMNMTETRPETDSARMLPAQEYTLEKAVEVNGRQGICCEGKHYWVSGSTTLTRYDREWKIEAENTDPFLGYEREVNHIGDIDVYNGELYVGAEYFMDGEGKNIQVAVYDGETLELKRTFPFEPESGQKECAGIAVDPDHGIVWMCSWVGEESGRYIYKYDLESGAYLGKVHLQMPPQWLQGIAYYDGQLYMTADDGEADYGEPDHMYRTKVEEGATAATVVLERTFDDVSFQGEIEGLSFDKERGQFLLLYNRGARIILGMPRGFYPGYDREISEVFVYNFQQRAAIPC